MIFFIIHYYSSLVEEQSDVNKIFGKELICKGPKTFKILSKYCSYMTQKKMAVKSTVDFFSDPSVEKAVKDIEGEKLAIRKEFLDLIKNFNNYITTKLYSLDGLTYLCEDKELEEIHVEIAKFLQLFIFRGKEILTFIPENCAQDDVDNHHQLIFPTFNFFFSEIKARERKSYYNKKCYMKKKHTSAVPVSKNDAKIQSIGSLEDEDENNNSEDEELTLA
jgi:hypothetical protein